MRQGGWDHLDMPAIALENEIIELGHGKSHARRSVDVLHPERESRETLKAIKGEVGSLMFSAQYQQRPVPVEGNLIRRSWFPAYDNLPAGPWPTKIAQSWDVAMMTGDQNDYSVCTTWLIHKNDAYLVDVYRARLGISGPAPQGYQSRGGASRDHDPDRGCGSRHESSAGSQSRHASRNDASDRHQA
jgi:hypothetical protein